MIGKLCIAATFMASMAAAQRTPAPNAAPVAKPLVFDVASIRPSKPGAQSSARVTPDGYVANGQDLWTLLMAAYFPQGIAYWNNDRLKNAPSWISEHYDVAAKVAPADVAEWQKHPSYPNPILGSALQALLADRLKLVVHRVPGQAPGEVLTIGKHGPLFKPTPSDEALPSTGMKTAEGGKIVIEDQGRTIRFYGVTMESFNWYLSMFSQPRQPIVDRSGLTGRYDLVLHRADPIPSATGQDSSGNTLSWDLNPLGLELKQVDLPSDTIVIDHIEKPSEN